ncbi:MAG: nucleotidyltransferase domain-containing protein [Chloroflexi bacterium]|nr:nucleotidyltransferase domain-containing protein [Chloroflexota bacterium]
MAIPDREPLLQHIVRELRSDARVVAAWLTGSIGRGEDDAWSDLDLHVAVYDPQLTSFWSEREALYARLGKPVLIQPEMVSNAQASGHFQLVIFDGPLEVDWNVGPLSVATRAPSHLLLFSAVDVPVALAPGLSADEQRATCQERLVFLWAMAPIAIKYIARGQTDRAIRQVGLVRDAFVDLWRLVEAGQPRVNSLNPPLEPRLRQILPWFGPTIDPPSCLDVLMKLCELTVELHPQLAARGIAIPEDMPAQVARIATEATVACVRVLPEVADTSPHAALTE